MRTNALSWVCEMWRRSCNNTTFYAARGWDYSSPLCDLHPLLSCVCACAPHLQEHSLGPWELFTFYSESYPWEWRPVHRKTVNAVHIFDRIEKGKKKGGGREVWKHLCVRVKVSPCYFFHIKWWKTRGVRISWAEPIGWRGYIYTILYPYDFISNIEIYVRTTVWVKLHEEMWMFQHDF